MSDLAHALPITVTVADRGAVTVEGGTRVVGMSPFSERARRLATDFGPGVHVLATAGDMREIGPAAFADLADALDV